MAINKWRYVTYLDDGVNRYQCLQCYGYIAASDWLGYYHNSYVACWHYCPLCGTKWEGSQYTGRGDDERQYGPRRQRIEDAIERWHLATGRYFNAPKPATFHWIIEELVGWRPLREHHKWEQKRKYDGFKVKPAEVLKEYHRHQESLLDNYSEDEGIDWFYDCRLCLERGDEKIVVFCTRKDIEILI